MKKLLKLRKILFSQKKNDTKPKPMPGKKQDKKAKRQVQQLSICIKNQGFVKSGIKDLWRLYEKGGPYKKRAAWELALWYANQYSREHAQKCLPLVGEALKGEDDPAFLRHGAIITAECHQLLGETKEAQKVIAEALSAGATADLYLAAATLETDSGIKLDLINKALSHAGAAPISAALTNNTLFDSLSAQSLGEAQTDDAPKVTVIMPVYNAEQMIKTALDSVLAQSWTNLEVLVADDCSTDNTAAIIKEYKQQDRRVQLVPAAANGGTYIARNLALQKATGDFVTCHDSDDWSHPDKIATQVKHLQQNPQVVANTSEMARATADLNFHRRGQDGFYIFSNMSSLMFRRREVMEQIGYWDCVRFGADSEYSKRIKKAFGKDKLVYLQTGPLAFLRQSETSLTGNSTFGFHGFKMGARLEYKESHNYYHSQADSLYYPFPQGDRPFPVPEPMWPQREAKEAGRRQFDIVYAADFRLSGYSDLLAQIKAQTETGLRVGLIQMYRYNQAGKRPISPEVRAALDGHKLQILVYGEKIAADKLVVLDPAVLQKEQKFLPQVHTHQLWVITDYFAGQANHKKYKRKKCKKNLKKYLGSSGTWLARAEMQNNIF